MQRILGFVCLIFMLSACDDGDLSVTSFEFTSLNLNKCADNTFIYNTSGNEALILNIPLSQFKNVQNVDQSGNIVPVIYQLTTSDNLVYRLYNAAINSSILCADLPVAEPKVVEEWTALSGATIEITTYANPDTENGGILNISGYTHHIVLKDVIFVKGNNQLVYQELVFGNYTTPNLIQFDFSSTLQNCSTDLLFKLNLREALVAELNYQALFPNQVTPENSPRTALISSDTNRIIYKVFNANVSGAYFCSTIPQTSPQVVQEWYAENGEEGLSGIIEVETQAVYDQVSSELTGYIHHIKLKNVRFYNANSNFYFEEYHLGDYGVEI